MALNVGGYVKFVCSCNEKKEYDMPDDRKKLFRHCREVHGVNLRDTKGTRELVMHIAKEPRHSSTYKWTFPSGLILYEYCG